MRIGSNIPIITSRGESATGNAAGLGTSVNVERQDIGVTLRVTPQISEGDTLRLKIFQELTEINKGIQADVGNQDSVGVASFNRKIENTVVVNDGETVVVGGLLSDTWDDAVFKVPYLGDIPGLGWAFKTTTKSLRKINLLVFLTPRIVRNAEIMELETIRKRMDFEDSFEDQYQTDPDQDQFIKKTDGVIDEGINPAYDALREHSLRYTPRRREEIETELFERERLSQQLEAKEITTTAYGLRLELYDDEDAAAAALLELLDAGYDGSLMSNNAGGKLVYELITGPYDDLKAAQAEADVLSEVYQFTPVVRVLQTTAQPSPEPAAESSGLGWPEGMSPSTEQSNE